MKIQLELMELAYLQNVCRRPGHYVPSYKHRKDMHYYKPLIDAGLIQTKTGLIGFGDALYPTKIGEAVLKNHLPVILNEDTDLTKPIGRTYAHYYL